MATAIFSAAFLAIDGSFWIGAPSTWNDDTPHTAPRRMILVTTQGKYQLMASDGMVRRFPIGIVVVVEDTSGVGHLFKIIGTEDDWTCAYKAHAATPATVPHRRSSRLLPATLTGAGKCLPR
jgi:hypothetical protein